MRGLAAIEVLRDWESNRHPSMGTGPLVATQGEGIRDKSDCNDFFDFVVCDGGRHNILC